MSSIEFNSLLLNNADFLKPFAFNLTKDNELAKDLIQETMFRALSNQEKYLEGSNIRAWLYTIMRNIFINNYRQKAKQHLVIDNSISDYLLNHQQAAIPNRAEASIQLKEINYAVYQLPVIFKQPFLLYFEGFKYFEIASMLQEPLGTIKSRIHFARRMLKAQVHRY
jgi:RNA polymerase sigma factor (sigma-70 family)